MKQSTCMHCSFLRPKEDKFVFQMPNMQRQPNGNDCGVLVIATATELALGIDSLSTYRDTKQISHTTAVPSDIAQHKSESPNRHPISV